MQDPHSVLGLPPSASKAEVKARFRQLAKQLHPDMDPSPAAHARFAEVKRATDALLQRQGVFGLVGIVAVGGMAGARMLTQAGMGYASPIPPDPEHQSAAWAGARRERLLDLIAMERQQVACFTAHRSSPCRVRRALAPRQLAAALQGVNSLRRLQARRAPVLAAQASEEVEITVEEDAMEKMDKTLASVRGSFATIAGVTAPEAALLVVQPYDISAIPAIEKAIMQVRYGGMERRTLIAGVERCASDLGLTPNNDGKLIRLQIPQLTAERRKEMAKTVSKLGEEGKVAVRNVRREAMKAIEKLEKEGAVSEDGRKALEASVQELTDDYVKQIDQLVKGKSEELSKV
eukprot:scaffold9.g3251.t1